jgi:pimeloyl-ACP methyl ester carboxylesterase
MPLYVIGASAVVGVLLISFALRIAAERRERSEPPPSRMIGPRGASWHIRVSGPGTGPTVVIEQGAGGVAALWWAVQDAVAEFATVVTYDRLGLGWSDPAPTRRDTEARAEELDELLHHANVPQPYVLVAHSYGGLIARLFARRHRDKTAALVLVDTLEEGTFFRPEVLRVYARFGALLAVIAVLQRLGLPRLWATLVGRPDDRDPGKKALAALSLRPEMYLGMREDFRAIRSLPIERREPWPPATFGALPVVVVTHGQPFPGPLAAVERHWAEGQKRLAALSTNSQLVVAEHSNHMIQDDEPTVVVDAIRRAYDAAVTGGRLAQ